MNILDALVQTYSVAGRLPDPVTYVPARRPRPSATRPLRGPAPGLLDTLRLLGRAARRGVQWYLARRRRRASIGELAALDDRTLKDIGVPRSEIPALVDALSREPRALDPVTRAGERVSTPRLWAAANCDDCPATAA